jgi:hypothetical protein
MGFSLALSAPFTKSDVHERIRRSPAMIVILLISITPVSFAGWVTRLFRLFANDRVQYHKDPGFTLNFHLYRQPTIWAEIIMSETDHGQVEHEQISTSLEVERLDVNLFRSKSLWLPARARGVFGGYVLVDL